MDVAVSCESKFWSLGMVDRKYDSSIFLRMVKRVVGFFLVEIVKTFAILATIKK